MERGVKSCLLLSGYLCGLEKQSGALIDHVLML